MVGLLMAIGVRQTTHAKRRPPAEVEAVVKGGIRYVVPHFGALHGKVQNGGYVFIVRVTVKEATLLVENELGETFEMDLDTGTCKASDQEIQAHGHRGRAR